MSNLDPFEETSLGKGWEAVDLTAQKRGGGKWIALEDGKSILINLVGDPEIFEKAGFKPGDPPQTKIRFDVFAPDENKMKVWELSLTTWKQVKRQRGKRPGEFDNSLFTVTRDGTGTSTKYFVEYERPLTQTEVDMREALLTPSFP